MRKRMTAMGLLLALLCVLLPVSVHGAEREDGESLRQYALLEAVGVFEQNASSDAKVSRADFVMQAMRLMGYDPTALTEESAQLPYADVDASAQEYHSICLAYRLGAIKRASLFHPREGIKLSEAAEILTELMGYRVMREQGNTAEVMRIANRAGLLSGLTCSAGDALCFADVTRLFHNALFAPVLELKSIHVQGGKTYQKGEILLTAAFAIRFGKGVMDANPVTSIYAEEGCGWDSVQIEEVRYRTNQSMYDFIGHNVEYYWKEAASGEREVVFLQDAEETAVLRVDADDLIDLTATELSYEDASGRIVKKRLGRTPSFLYNGKLKSLSTIDISKLNGSVTAIDNNGDGVYEVVSVTAYQHIRVTGVDLVCAEVHGAQSGQSYLLESRENIQLVRLLRDGAAISLSEVGAGDILSIAASSGAGVNLLDVRVKRQTVQGSVLSLTEKKLTVDDTSYPYDPSAVKPRVGDYGVFYLSFDGKIVDAVLEDYVVYGYLYRMESRLFDSVYAKIFSDKGRWVELEVASRMTYNGSRTNAAALLQAPELFENGTIKPQLITYRVNAENKLTSLATALEASWGTKEEEQAREAGRFRLSKTLSSAYFRSTTYSFNMEVMLGADSQVFVIPGAYGETELKEEDVYLTGRALFEADTTYTDLYFYDMSVTGTAPVMVICGTPKKRADAVYPILYVGETLDSEHNVCGMLQVLNNGYEMELRTAESLDLRSTGVRKGDVAELSVNRLGEVDGITILYRPIDAVYQNTMVNNVYHSRTLVSGKAVYADTAENRLVFVSDDRRYIYDTSAVTVVYCYDTAKQELRTGSLTELLPGKQIFMQARYGRVQTLLICE